MRISFANHNFVVPKKEINMFPDMGKWKRSKVDIKDPMATILRKEGIIKLERVQKGFPRKLPGMEDLSYKQRLELFSLKHGKLRGDLIEVYKIMRGTHEPTTLAVGLELHIGPDQAYTDYIGFVLTLNESVKGKKLTCDYKTSASEGVPTWLSEPQFSSSPS
eukprot:g41370.t1